MPDDEDTGTQAFVPDFGDAEDTGAHSVPFVPNFDDTGPLPAKQSAASDPKQEAEAADADAESVAASVLPVAVPGRYQYLKWWKLVLVILGVWLAAAEVGLSLFYWWYHTIDKTAAVFMVLVYVVVCVVAGVLLAMVQGRPLISALSIAVMSGPFASVAAAAPLYGYYYCVRTGHCLVGVIPY
ncbi:hypothetical protein [Mycobacterium rhizamassiliense]|uniref:hypothetical protein n=1 Tax=Mycobacterium rhizamassiliense TaxID=1841860 RepID=UPI00097D7253|nr:hypothetical protein [Mycobacterium rhizamassiliense]